MRVGVDLGGTKILGVALDGTEVVASAKRDTPLTGAADVAAAIAECVGRLGDSAIDTIGIGAPGVIDRAAGTIVRAPNLSLEAEAPLTSLVAEAVGIDVDRVVLENDVNAATTAEHRLGAAYGTDDVLCVFVGTGVGGGLVLGGELRHGASGVAGEIGHTVVRDGGRRCGCGGLGHLEAYAGRRCLEAEARRLHDSGRPTALVSLAGRGRMKSSVFERALAAGDEVARKLVDEAIDALGAALASAVALVDLDLIVVGGGLADRLGDPFVSGVAAAVRKRLFLAVSPLRVVPAGLGDLAGAIGAAMLPD